MSVLERIKINPLEIKKESSNIQDIDRYEFIASYVKDKVILDAACGSGYGTFFLYEKGKADMIFGADIDVDSIRNLNEISKNNNKISFSVEDITSLTYQNDFFDMIVSFETIEHITNVDLYLSEFKRVLKQNGIVAISTPLNETEDRFQPANPYHIREYNLTEITSIVQKHFHIEDIFFQCVEIERNMITKSMNNLGLYSNHRKVHYFLKNLIPKTVVRIVRNLFNSKHDIVKATVFSRHPENASVVLIIARKK
ncbi:MAG: class I SAM-dependent methyltransferase [Chitinophagaceae bacterium]